MPADLRFRAYLAAVSGTGLVALFVSAPLLPLQEWQGLLFFAALCGIAQIMPIPLFRSSSVSVSAAVTLAALFLYGPAAGVWINLASSLVAAFRPKPKPLYKTIFNTGMHALAAAVAGGVFWGAGGRAGMSDPVLLIVPAVGAATSYFLVETFLISGVIALTEYHPLREVWNVNFRWSALNFVALGVISLGMAQSKAFMGYMGVAIFLVPLAMAWHSFRLYMTRSRAIRMQVRALELANEKLEASYVSTIRALAAAIDAKDHYTHGHSEMTTRYAVAVAREIGLSEEDVAMVHIAGLLHDVGKIGMPDGVLNKPAKLSDEERNIMMEHPVVGANLVLQVDLLGFAIEGVQHHHERYDGKGYPNGLQGDQIPMWAQIIAVADSFQAMTSARPYRPAFTLEQGLEELKRCAGTQFNARLVEAMERVLGSGKWAEELATPKLPRLLQISEEALYAEEE